jgi:hypothetical protein
VRTEKRQGCQGLCGIWCSSGEPSGPLIRHRQVRENYSALYSVAVVAAFILVWINLAVGIIGSEDNPANLMYGGVLAVGLLGALIVRFQPHGMARALAVTALAQALVGVITLIAGWGSAGANWPGAIVVLTGFFAVLWLVSAWLFQKAAREQTSAGAAP